MKNKRTAVWILNKYDASFYEYSLFFFFKFKLKRLNSGADQNDTKVCSRWSDVISEGGDVQTKFLRETVWVEH